MGLSARWVGFENTDLITDLRVQCYAPAQRETAAYRSRMQADLRAADGDFLVVERDGRPVGTATSLSLRMFVRGAEIATQGVAWVGTIRTERRKGAAGGQDRPGSSAGGSSAGGSGGPAMAREPGVATVVMQNLLARARERGQPATALMPFRSSFYEHFGYGNVERRCDWTIPTSLLPVRPTPHLRNMNADDLGALSDLQHRIARRGQCEFARSPSEWAVRLERAQSGFTVIDREDHGPASSWASFVTEVSETRAVCRVVDMGAADTDALMRLLSMFGSLKDQYSHLILTTQADYPLNRILRESQVPHRPVVHATSEPRVYTRMQVRVLDHVAFVSGINWNPSARGVVEVAVSEPEQTVSRFRIDVADGRAAAVPSTSSSPHFATDAGTWAAVICGDLTPRVAVELGLASAPADADAAVSVLESMCRGPAPFTNEYF